MDAAERLWRDRVMAAARKAVKDLRSDNPFEHREMIENLEALIRRLTQGEMRRP